MISSIMTKTRFMTISLIKILIPKKYHKRIRYKSAKIRSKLKRRKSLTSLAIFHECDKWGAHFYTPHYEQHFHSFKEKEVSLLELGIGGYEDPHRGGASLKMWKDFFKKGKIFGIDIHDKSKIEEDRIKTFQGSQDDEFFLKKVINQIGEPDIIIDDGSHVNSHIIESFKILFPLLKKGGIYVVEDVQTSYWPSYGGNSENMEDKKTAVNFFKSLIHGLNHEEILQENYQKSYFDLHITSIHFYHNLIFIYKGDNNEPSNMVKKNKLKVKV